MNFYKIIFFILLWNFKPIHQSSIISGIITPIMTSIVDVLFNSGQKLPITHQSTPASPKNKSLQRPFSGHSATARQDNQFLIRGSHPKYDLFLETKLTQHQTMVQVFLISKFGQILKTNSDISRIELIQRCINEREFYRPSVNPITGFLYFKLDFFNLQKGTYEFLGRNKVDLILKGIDVQKLILSIQKVQGIQKSQEKDDFQGWFEEQCQLKLSLAKAIAASIQDPNIETKITNQLKCIDSKQLKLRSLRIQYIQRFIESSNQKKIPVNHHRIRESFKEIVKGYSHVGTFIKKKNRRINFDNLYISPEARKKLNEIMNSMCLNDIEIATMNVFEESFGNVSLKLEKLSTSNFEKRLSFFKVLSKNHEYDQLEKYFDSGEAYPIQISLEAKGDNLLKFLEKNGKVMSLQTKMRLLVQIYTFVNVLWQENELIYLIDNLKTIIITKRLGVKMRGLENHFKSQKEMIWEDFDLLNKKRSESILNLSSLFFKIFYQLNLLYTRPKVLTSTKTLLFDECKLNGIEKMNTSKYLPKQVTGKTKELLTSLNYVFSQQVYTASKILRKLQRKQMIESMKRQANYFKMRDLQTAADCSDEESQGEESRTQRLLSTKNLNCWLLKNI